MHTSMKTSSLPFLYTHRSSLLRDPSWADAPTEEVQLPPVAEHSGRGGTRTRITAVRTETTDDE